MKNNFALSFGLSLIIIGQISSYIKVSDVIMLGVALSACAFSSVSLALSVSKKEKHEIVYVIPLLFLLSFCCFGDTLNDLEIVKKLINSGYINSITFFSFGMFFLSEYINKKNEVFFEKEKYIRITGENLEYAESIIEMVDDYKKTLESKNITIDSDSKNLIDRIYELFREKMQQCSINSNLLVKNKDEFNLDDVNEAFVNSTGILREKIIKEKMVKDKEKNKSRKKIT